MIEISNLQFYHVGKHIGRNLARYAIVVELHLTIFLLVDSDLVLDGFDLLRLVGVAIRLVATLLLLAVLDLFS